MCGEGECLGRSVSRKWPSAVWDPDKQLPDAPSTCSLLRAPSGQTAPSPLSVNDETRAAPSVPPQRLTRSRRVTPRTLRGGKGGGGPDVCLSKRFRQSVGRICVTSPDVSFCSARRSRAFTGPRTRRHSLATSARSTGPWTASRCVRLEWPLWQRLSSRTAARCGCSRWRRCSYQTSAARRPMQTSCSEPRRRSFRQASAAQTGRSACACWLCSHGLRLAGPRRRAAHLPRTCRRCSRERCRGWSRCCPSAQRPRQPTRRPRACAPSAEGRASHCAGGGASRRASTRCRSGAAPVPRRARRLPTSCCALAASAPRSGDGAHVQDASVTRRQRPVGAASEFGESLAAAFGLSSCGSVHSSVAPARSGARYSDAAMVWEGGAGGAETSLHEPLGPP